MPLRLALIDNYDSYTYNLSHLLASATGTPPTVVRADAYPTLSALLSEHDYFDGYVLSPGPGSPHNPADFPRLEREIIHAGFPVLGVCLGHQGICAQFGARVSNARAGPAHGVVATVECVEEGGLMEGMPKRFSAVRYHSLAVETPLHSDLIPTAWTEDEIGERKTSVLMAMRHRWKPLYGVQFHPESVGTKLGFTLARNFAKIVGRIKATRFVSSGPPNVEDRHKQGPLQREKGVSYKTRVRQIPDIAIETADLFVELYRKHNTAFWLDSSSATRLGSSVSRCSSPERNNHFDRYEKDHEKETVDQQKGRFSIMGSCNGPKSEIVTYNVGDNFTSVINNCCSVEQRYCMDVFDYLDQSLKQRHAPQHPELPVEMNGGYIGFFGYELKANIDGVRGNRHTSDLPDAWFVFADRIIVVDHMEATAFLVSVVDETDKSDVEGAENWFDSVSQTVRGIQAQVHSESICRMMEGRKRLKMNGQVDNLLQFSLERSKAAYLSDIRKCLREIYEGETYEVCLTNRLKTILPDGNISDPLDVYCALRLINPAPYAAFLRLSRETAVCCSSPERYLHITSKGIVESKPIKGTLPRGRSLQEDEELRFQLRNSKKDRSENMMIVDLVRNDLSRTCSVGSVQVPKLMQVESYPTVHQLVSTVTGILAQNGDAVRCIRSAYPMGSMTGAPKIRTMEIIDQLERSGRGIYSGSIGYLSLCGSADLNVVIRTAVIRGRGVTIGVGGAIVALSQPEEEYNEILLKGQALMRSLALTVTGKDIFEIVEDAS